MRWLHREDGAGSSTTLLGSAAAGAVVLALLMSTTPGDVGGLVVDGIKQAITQEGEGVAAPVDGTDSLPAAGTDSGAGTLLAQATPDQRIPVSQRQQQFDEWHRTTFGVDPAVGEFMLTPEQRQQVAAKRTELGLAPDWGVFTMTDRGYDLWFDRVPEQGLGAAVPPAALGYMLSGLGPSIAILSGQIGLAGGIAAQSTGIPRELVGQTALGERPFQNPLTNYAVSMGAIGTTQWATDWLARQVQAGSGLGLTPMGQRFIEQATTLGERERFIQYALDNGGRSGNHLSNYRLDTGKLAPYVFAAGALVTGSNEFLIPHVDKLLSPDLQRTEDGKPIFANDAEWLAFYGPRAASVGLGVSLPFTSRCIARGGSAQECAATAGMTIGLPLAQTALTNAVVNPPQEGLVRDFGVPVGQFLSSTAEGAQNLWRGWTEDPTAMNPVARLGGVPVNLAIAASHALGDITGQIMAPPDPERLARGELTGIFTPEAQERINAALGRTNATIRTYGETGRIVADGFAELGQTAGNLFNSTLEGTVHGARHVVNTLGELTRETGRVMTDVTPAREAVEILWRAADEVAKRTGRIVTGQPVGPLDPFAPAGTSQPVDQRQPQPTGNAGHRNAPIPGLSGPCDDPSCPNWGRFAGEKLVGPAIVGPAIVEPGIVGERIVGPQIVGPGGPYTQQEQNWLDLQNNVIRSGYDTLHNILRPAGAVELFHPMIAPPPPPNQSLPSRAGEALQNSGRRIQERGLRGVGEVLRDGWNCVTRPRECLRGPQSNLPGSEVLVASLPGTDLALTVEAVGNTGTGDRHLAFQPDLPGTTQWEDYSIASGGPTVDTNPTNYSDYDYVDLEGNTIGVSDFTFDLDDPAPATIHDPAPATIHDPAPATIHDPAPTTIHDPAPTTIHDPVGHQPFQPDLFGDTTFDDYQITDDSTVVMPDFETFADSTVTGIPDSDFTDISDVDLNIFSYDGSGSFNDPVFNGASDFSSLDDPEFTGATDFSGSFHDLGTALNFDGESFSNTFG